MKNESDDFWLRECMQELRQRAAGTAPPFDRVWRRAFTPTAPPRLGWRLASASFAALLVLMAAFSWSSHQRARTAQMERAYDEMEGVLMTYWQAPTDTLFPSGDGEGNDQR